MKKTKFGVALSLALAVTALVPAVARAQMDSSAPITVKQKQPKVKLLTLKAEVVRADGHLIIVRELANALMVHTFSYGDKAAQKMAKILANGGYRNGDKVEIQYAPGTTVALAIKGKPSKAI